jgi:TolA-binding protein
MHKIGLFLLTLFFCAQIQAQKTQSYQPKSKLYSRALELFDKEKYNASIEVFKDFIKVSKDKMMQSDANFYIAASKLKLSHSNAERQMLDFIEDYPYSSKLNLAYLLMGNYYFDKKKYRRSIRYFKEVELNGITKEEEHKLRFEYGYALFQSKKYVSAKKQLYPLTVKDDNAYYVLANYYYGYVSYMNEDYDEALKTFKKIETKSGIPNTMMLYIAQIYYIKGEHDKSLAYCEKVKAQSVVRERDFLKGKNYYRKNNYKQAAIHFQSSNFSIDSLQSEEIYEIGNTYYQTGNCSKAIPLFKEISNEGNDVAQAASFSLGDCFVQLNQKDKAESAFFEAQRTDYDKKIKEMAMFNYAKLTCENGKTSTALTYFKKYNELYPEGENAEEVKGHLADIFLQTKDYKTAISTLESIKNKNNKLQETYQKLCMLEGKQQFTDKKYKSSELYFTKSLTYKIDQKLVSEAYYWLGESNFQNNDYNSAISYYNKTISSKPSGKTSALAHYGLGYAYFMKKNYSLAIQNFTKYKSLSASFSPDPSIFNDAVLRIGDSYLVMGAKEKNKTYYQAASNNYAYISSRNVKGADYALFQRGLIFGLLGQPKQKIATLKRIPTEFPKSYYIPDALYETGSEQLNLGIYGEAERNFQYIIQDYKGSIYARKSHYSLGIIYYNQNKDNQALLKFKYVVKNYPNTLEARTSLERIESIYTNQGKTDEYEVYVKSVPNYSKGQYYFDSLAYRAALNKYQSSNYASAVTEFSKYLNKYKNGIFQIESHYYRATSYEAINKISEAILDYKFVADARINDFAERSIYKTAKLSKEKLDDNTAFIYYGKWEALVKNNKDLAEAVYEQLRILHAANNISKAKPKASQLLFNVEANTYMKKEANLVLAKSYINDSLLNTAIATLKKVIDGSTTILGAEGKYLESWCYFELGELDKCKQGIIEFNKKFSGYDYWLGKSLLLLSDYYVAKDDAFSAKSTLNSILANFDDERILSKAREKLAAIEKGNARLNNINNLAPGKGE